MAENGGTEQPAGSAQPEMSSSGSAQPQVKVVNAGGMPYGQQAGGYGPATGGPGMMGGGGFAPPYIPPGAHGDDNGRRVLWVICGLIAICCILPVVIFVIVCFCCIGVIATKPSSPEITP